MHAIFLAPESVGNIPVLRAGPAGYVRTSLDVLDIRLLSDTVATDIRAYGSAGNRAAGSGKIFTTSTTYLVAQNPTDNGTGNCAGNIGVALILYDLFTFYPAALLRSANNCTDRSDSRFI